MSGGPIEDQPSDLLQKQRYHPLCPCSKDDHLGSCILALVVQWQQKTLRLILPSWRVGLTKEQMGRTHGQPLSINLMIVMLNVGGEMVHTTWQKAFPIQRSLPNHVLSSAVAFMARKVSTAKKARFLWKQVSSSSTHQCPPKRFLHHLVLTWKAYRIQLHLRVGVILPAYNTFTSDIQSYHIRYPFASIGFAMLCLFGTLKQSTSTLYKILHYSYYLIQNASY